MTATTQRWRDRRAAYRPAGEPIDVSRYAVDVIEERAAKSFVERHHYSGSYPASRLRVGLFRGLELVGAAVFSVPMNERVIPSRLGVESKAGVELGRFVLLDDVPANGETWFLARAFRALRDEKPGVRAVLAYSDPVPRRTADGLVVMPGHIGTIYQAHNGRFLGRSCARTLLVTPAGTVASARALSKLRTGDRGAEYAYQQLVAAGCPRLSPGEPIAAWLARLPLRRVRHPGNFAYAWQLDARTAIPASVGPYPKREAA